MPIHIDDTYFGSITAAGETYDHDIFISLEGDIRKRKKKLSKRQYGSSHIVSLVEAEYIYEEGAHLIIIGTGQSDHLRLSSEADHFFKEHRCRIIALPTPQAVHYLNESAEKKIGLFHITC